MQEVDITFVEYQTGFEEGIVGVHGQERLVLLSDSLGTVEWSDFLLIGWDFLMRIQSECLPLQCGEPSEKQVLDPVRHSAVYHDAQGNLVIRWTRRKNRPRGSILRWKCWCALKGAFVCITCRMRVRLRQLTVGEKVWTFHTGRCEKEAEQVPGFAGF